MSAPDVPSNPPPLSTSIVIGIVLVILAAGGLISTLAIIYVRRRRRSQLDLEGKPEALVQRVGPNTSGKPRAVHRANITASIILPVRAPQRPEPVTPVPEKQTQDSRHPPGLVVDCTNVDFDYAPFSPAPFSPSERATTIMSNGTVTVIQPLPFRRKSMVSVTSGTPTVSTAPSTPTVKERFDNSRQVRSVFTPLLPDELVIRVGENLTIIRSFDDGWCFVGRRSPFGTMTKPTLGKSPKSPKTKEVEDVEVGVVPTWVFEENQTDGENEKPRPSRTTSMSLFSDDLSN